MNVWLQQQFSESQNQRRLRVRPLEIDEGFRPATVLRRCGAFAASTNRAAGLRLPDSFDPDQVPSVREEVVFVKELLAGSESEVGEPDPVWVVTEKDAALARQAERSAVDQKAVQVIIRPAEGDLKDVVQVSKRGAAGHK